MKRLFMKLGLFALVFAVVMGALAPQVHAQLAPPSQVSLRNDAGNSYSTNAASASTTTLTPVSGQYAYIYSIHIDNCAGATAVTAAGVTTITTTNLPGSPIWTLGSGTTAGACAQSFSETYPSGLKALATGAVTFVLPTFATNQTIRLNIMWASGN